MTKSEKKFVFYAVLILIVILSFAWEDGGVLKYLALLALGAVGIVIETSKTSD